VNKKYCHIIPPIWTVRHPDQAAGWITEHVRQNGWDVELIDFNAELYNLEDRPLVKDCWRRTFVAMSPQQFTHALFDRHDEYIKKRLAAVVDDGCRVFGALLLDAGARFTGMMSALIKEMAPDAHVVVGGTGSTSLFRLRRRYKGAPPMQHPVDVEMPPDNGIDSWVLGEGEDTLLELLGRLEAGEDLHGVRGLVLSEDGPLTPYKERPLIKDLSRLHHPTYEGFDLSLYQFDSLPFQLSRGCAFARCSHCGLKGYSRGFRVREPAHALAELEYLVDRYDTRTFHFTDLNVNGDLEKLEEFCDRLIDSGMDIDWQSFVQIRGDMTARLMEKVVRSGCTSLNYGFESGSDKVLQLMRKQYTADEAADVLKLTTDAGGKSVINLMVGHPGEGEEEFQETLDFLERNARNIGMVASVSFTSVLIHSPLLDECESFDIDVDGMGRWRSRDGGLDRTVRNDRVHRVTELLRMLGIPCFEAFWEPAADDQAEQGPPPSVGYGGAWARITDLRLCSPDGELEEVIPTHQPLMIRVGYRSANFAAAAVDLGITDPDGNPVFSTEPSTETVRTHHLAEQGWLQLVLRPHDLPEGDYLVSVRLRWPFSDKVFDRFVLRDILRVRGEQADLRSVETPYTWTHHVEQFPHSWEGPVGLVRVTDGMGDEPIILVANQTCELVADILPGDEQGAQARYRLLNVGGGLVHESEPEAVPAGETTTCRWDLTDLRLGTGQYDLEVEVALPSQEEPFISQHHLDVGNALTQEDRGREDLALWAQWELPAAALSNVEETSPRLFSIELHRRDNREGAVAPGDHLTMVGTFLGLPPSIYNLAVRVWVADEHRILASEVISSRTYSPHGMMLLHLHIQANIPAGHYDLNCAMWNEVEARAVEPVWTFPLMIQRG